jgi:hypothetical protein
MMVPGQWHVFISHSSDDKEEIARPLALALRRRGLDVWFDEFVLRPGDSLREGIDEGIAKSTFGVIILSPSFLAKKWTKAELSAFFSKQISGTKKTIVPIWHNVSGAVVQEYVPLLGDRLALNSDVGLPALVQRVLMFAR